MTTTTITRLSGRRSDGRQTQHATERGIGRHTGPTGPTGPTADRGYTLIELILVCLILGVLTAAITLSVGSIRTEAAGSGCHTDRRIVAYAVEAYFAATGQDAIAADGGDADRFEQTLVAAGLLRGVSEYHHVAANGAITPEADSEC